MSVSHHHRKDNSNNYLNSPEFLKNREGHKSKLRRICNFIKTKFTTSILVIVVSVIIMISSLYFWWKISMYFTTPIPVVLLKLPRTGSSWITQLLNEIPSVYISKEIVQGGDRDKLRLMTINNHINNINNVKRNLKYDVENHLLNALMYPTDKFAYKDAWIPSGRFFEDYFYRGKLFSTSKVIGYSINLEHLSEFNPDWSTIFKQVERKNNKNLKPKVLLLLRSNFVKTMVSVESGKVIRKVCSSSNVRINDECIPMDDHHDNNININSSSTNGNLRGNILSSVHPNEIETFSLIDSTSISNMSATANHHSYRLTRSSLNWTLPEFITELNSVMARHKRMIEAAKNLPHKHIIITYEDFQINEKKAMKRLLTSIGVHENQAKTMVNSMKTINYLGLHGWKKRGSEDLSKIFVNYDKFTRALSFHRPCQCVLKMLTSTEPDNFQNCTMKELVYIKKEKSGNIREDIVRCEEPTYHLSPSEAKERLYKQFIMNGE